MGKKVLAVGQKPPIGACLNVWDLKSGGDDEITFRENHAAFSRIWMLPRVLVNVEDIDTSCEMIGAYCSLPIYVTGTALGRLYHEDGEMCLTRAAYEQGIVQMCPTLASCTMDEMVSAKRPGQHQWWQLYVNRDREVTRKVIKKAEAAGMEGLFITVDAPQLGRRERDMRRKTEQQADVQSDQAEEVKKDEGVTRAISTFIDPSLNWDSLRDDARGLAAGGEPQPHEAHPLLQHVKKRSRRGTLVPWLQRCRGGISRAQAARPKM